MIHHASRAIEIVATTPNPAATFMDQCARLLTDPVFGFLRTARFLIIDRDSKFSEAFRSTLKAAGVTTAIRCPASAPNCNAYAERWVRSAKEECLHRMIFFGQAALHQALREYAVHHNRERPHQGIGNELVEPREPMAQPRGRVHCRERLGGLLRFYYRRAG